MGGHVYTHEELLKAYKKKKIEIMHAKVFIKNWKKRAKDAEKTISEYVLVNKPPDYFYSFSGGLIFRRFHRLNGLTQQQTEFLIILSYSEVFLREHLKLFRKNWINVEVILDQLIAGGYVIKIKVPGKHKHQFRVAWVLTQRGKDFEADYERYYNEKIAEIRAKKFSRFAFEDGAYFRKRKIFRYEQRQKQGGGHIAKRGIAKLWVDINPINAEENEET